MPNRNVAPQQRQNALRGTCSRTLRSVRAGWTRFGSACCCLVAALATLGAAGRAAAAGGRAAPPADLAIAAAAHATEWVSRFSPPVEGTPEAAFTLEGVDAVCVVLRAGGRTIGSGTAAAPSAPDERLRDAVAAALSEALGDPTVARLRNEMPDALGRQLTTELELAGPLDPLPGRTFDDVARRVAPAADGIALRRGEEVARFFPAQLRSMNRAGRVSAMFRALAVELGLPPAELDDLQDRFGVRVYRFPVAAVAQRAPGRPFAATVRGMRLVTDGAFDRARLALAADRLADHIMQSLWAGEAPLGLRGTYLPYADRYEPDIAAPRDQALAAFALARYAALSEHHPAQAQRLRLGAELLLSQLDQVDATAGEADPFADPEACAAVLLTLAALPPPDEPDDRRLALAVRAGAVVRTMADAWHSDPEARPPRPHTGALLAAALVSQDEPAARETGRTLLDRLWDAVPASAHLDLLPWVALGEARWAKDHDGRSPHEAELGRLLEMAVAIQVRTPAEFAGGFDLQPTRAGLPDAQGLRVLAGLAALAAGPGGVPAVDRDRLETAVRTGLRFGVQLAVEDEDLWSCRNAHRSVGGIRTAVWDTTMPVAAQAVGLLAFTDGLAAWGMPDPPAGLPSSPR